MALYLGSQKCGGVNVKTQTRLQSKTITPSTSTKTYLPDSGYDGFSSVTVNAASGGGSSGGSGATCSGTISSQYTTFTIYYFNGSDLITKELTSNALSAAVPQNSIVAVYSYWGEILALELTNAEEIVTTYDCDSCSAAISLFKVTGNNFKIGLN